MVVELGATVIVPPEYDRLYDVPLDPVTRIEAALVSFTIRVSDCPEEMLLELALIETVGMEAAALAAKAETKTKARRGANDFISSHGVHSSRFALWCEVSRWGSHRPLPERDGQRQ